MKLIRNASIAFAFATVLAAGCASSPTSRGTGQVIDDASITARVKTALIKADDVPATAINVNTFRGVVQLSGFVENQSAADRAVAAAKQVDGVQSVKNDLRVAPRR